MRAVFQVCVNRGRVAEYYRAAASAAVIPREKKKASGLGCCSQFVKANKQRGNTRKKPRLAESGWFIVASSRFPRDSLFIYARIRDETERERDRDKRVGFPPDAHTHRHFCLSVCLSQRERCSPLHRRDISLRTCDYSGPILHATCLGICSSFPVCHNPRVGEREKKKPMQPSRCRSVRFVFEWDI